MNVPSQSFVENMLARGVEAGVFPGAVSLWGNLDKPPLVAMAGCKGRTRNCQPVTEDVIYDLASVTKVICTTSLAMIFHSQGKLDLSCPLPDGPLRHWLDEKWPDSWRSITPAHLLCHQSGLPPWRPYYCLPAFSSIAERKKVVLKAILSEAPEAEPGQRTIYSDLNFILLGFLLEAVYGDGLDTAFKNEIVEPLNLSITFRPHEGNIAPTEDGFRKAGPINNPDALWRGPTPLGRVNDDNAAYLGGVSGHAGLFASIKDIWSVLIDWSKAMNGQGVAFKPNIRKFIQLRPDSEGGGRALGFDLKTIGEKSVFSPNTVGHLGYTGPSVWWDTEHDFAWVVLCNRIHPTARNTAIVQFRKHLFS